MKRISIGLILHVVTLGVFIIHTYGCGPSEYQSNAGECCPMCSIGQVVLRECAGDSSTTCKPCSKGTFMSEPNGLTNCFPCKTCDNEQGLYISRTCTTISNTWCEVLDGYHCKSYTEKECTFALKHRKCEPGEEIKRPGTKDSDTVCEACPPGFFSPLGINCTKWTDCLFNGEIKNKEGSSTEDVQCREKARGRYGLIATAIFLFSAFFGSVFLNVGQKTVFRSHQTNNGNEKELGIAVQETVFDHSASPASLNIPEENKEEDLT